MPNIKIELITHDTGSTAGIPQKLEELAASIIVPDLILTGDPTDDYVQEIIQPLDELVEKHNVDLGKVNSSVIDTIRSMDSDGRL